jgi:RNA polymerase sigma factor (sigma-70 family)
MGMEVEVTLWLERLAQGDEEAARQIWMRYSQQMLALARKRLGTAERRAADEEDVALSAFHSLCHRLKEGQFPELKDRESLWKLLTTIIARKAAAELRRNFCQKRGGGQVHGESTFFQADETVNDFGIDNIAGLDPTPEFAAEMMEQCSNLLARLPDDCRQVALLKLDGYSNEEIAGRLGVALRTVERNLASIRSTWRKEGLADPGKRDSRTE